jgi:hypothetical protein
MEGDKQKKAGRFGLKELSEFIASYRIIGVRMRIEF